MRSRRTLTPRDEDDIAAARSAWQDRRGQRLREAAQLTQDEVARAISTDVNPVSRESVGAWENGDRTPRGVRALEYGRWLRRQSARFPDVDAEPAEVPVLAAAG